MPGAAGRRSVVGCRGPGRRYCPPARRSGCPRRVDCLSRGHWFLPVWAPEPPSARLPPAVFSPPADGSPRDRRRQGRQRPGGPGREGGWSAGLVNPADYLGDSGLTLRQVSQPYRRCIDNQASNAKKQQRHAQQNGSVAYADARVKYLHTVRRDENGGGQSPGMARVCSSARAGQSQSAAGPAARWKSTCQH